MQFDEAGVERIFAYPAPQGDQGVRYGGLREMAKRLAQAILLACPESRERSLALTKVQEAVMWANASIAINEPLPLQMSEPMPSLADAQRILNEAASADAEAEVVLRESRELLKRVAATKPDAEPNVQC